ncbi:hypothetical protein MesoLj113c_26520 [Mesorhizobium sp. 113-3-9]|jgi:hypothetical protein|nr:hypothetical protein MesoLj113c_26520 [Mesorhizobium sp. 113-3-9]
MKNPKWNATVLGPCGNLPRGQACKEALVPHVVRLRELALQSGWTPTEIGMGLLAVAAEQLKELGYGETIN